MTYTIILRRDRAQRWTSYNPVLGEGEPGFETDTNRLKIGDGASRWTDLPYIADEDGGGSGGVSESDFLQHVYEPDIPHPVYDPGADLVVLYENAKV